MKKLFTALLLLSFIFIASCAHKSKMELAKQDLAGYMSGLLNGYEAVDSGEEYVFFINKESVKFQGDNVIIWYATYDFKEMRLYINQKEYNCRESTSRDLYMVVYENQKKVYSGKAPSEYSTHKPIIPNSNNETMLKYACSLRNNY